jgi:hypothetical protein
VLQRRTCNILEGKKISDFYDAIRYEETLRMKVEGSMIDLEKIRCYLIYELVRDEHERMLMMRNYRIFLAIEVFSTTDAYRCIVSAALFMVKSCRFTGEIDDVAWLRNDILKHHHVKYNSSFKYDLPDQILKLDLDVEPGRETKINVVLMGTDEYCEYGPIFHRANSFV